MILLVSKNEGNNMILEKQYLKSKDRYIIIMNNGTANHIKKKIDINKYRKEFYG